MDHVTTSWAAAYGLPDPGIPADAVLAARPEALRSLAECFGAVAGALRDGSDDAARADTVLLDGWSTPALCALVADSMAEAQLTAESCDGNAAALGLCADGLDRCRAAVRQAYADADAAISAQGLPVESNPFAILSFGGPNPFEQQRMVVRLLYGATRAIFDDTCTLAAALYAGLGPDPRPDLPGWLPTGTTTPSGHTAASVDTANRASLHADLTSASPSRRAFAVHVQQALRHAANTTGGAVQLLQYDPEHPSAQGGAAIAVGDVTAADSVAVLVPGVGNSPSDMSDLLDTAASLNSAADTAAPGTSTATVVWVGYTVPLNGSGAMSSDPVDTAIGNAALATNALDATAGGEQLSLFCQRLRSVMDTSAGLTLIGHSYGSMVVSEAALDLGPDAGVDDIVMLAPPGAGYRLRTAADYRAVSPDHVYALAFPRDPIPHSITDGAAAAATMANSIISRGAGGDGSPFGPDPTSPGYGAQVIAAPSGVPVRHDPPGLLGSVFGGPGLAAMDRTGVNPVRNLNQHDLDNYLGGAARAAVAAVVVGKYSTVPLRQRK